MRCVFDLTPMTCTSLRGCQPCPVPLVDGCRAPGALPGQPSCQGGKGGKRKIHLRKRKGGKPPKHSPNLLNELVFRQRRLEKFDLVALALEHIHPGLVDVFQEQDLDVLSIERLELFDRRPEVESPSHEAAVARRRRVESVCRRNAHAV